MKNLRIICGPTGQYYNKLFRTARSKGFFTCFVNAESVAKFQVIETNDTGGPTDTTQYTEAALEGRSKLGPQRTARGIY